ncbi:MAG TPA: hypothetical protein VI756_11040, partial [Blastocatellia bacterium]
LWQEYQNRIRQRRIDAGLGFIDPPDEDYLARSKADHDGLDESPADHGPKLEVRTLEVKKLKVKRLRVGTLKVAGG